MRSTARIAAALAAAVVVASSIQAQTVVRGPYLQLGTPTSVVVRWRTDVPTDSRVRFGMTTALGSEVTDAAQTTEHVVTVSGLNPETQYYYGVGTTTLTLASGSTYFFRTSPPVGTRKPTRVWVLGDSGQSNVGSRKVRDAYYAFTGARHTDLWLMLGDNAYNSGTDSEFQNGLFQNYFETMLRKSVLWPSFGNHDGFSADSATQTGPYYDIFTLPAQAEAGGVASMTEAYYSFDYANIHFVCLDTSETSYTPGSPMLTWLAADLAATAQQWVVAFMHHAPYTRGSHSSDEEADLIAVRENICPILETHGVDLVLCGHTHSYERSMLINGHYGLGATFGSQHVVDGGDGQVGGDGAYRKPAVWRAPNAGCAYVVMGASAILEPHGTFDHPAMVYSEVSLGSLVLDVDGDQLDLRFINSIGATRDHFTMVKGPVSAVDQQHPLVTPLSTWKYHDLGQNLGTAWRTPGYDDSSWASGPGVLGFGEPYVTTIVSYGPNPANVWRTTYFRTTFTLPFDPALAASVRLHANYDDGFVAWLNGQHAAHSASLPYVSPSYNQFAASHEGGAYEIFEVPPGQLVAGTNVLAVEVHQSAANSDDLVWDGSLECDAFVPLLGAPATGNAGPGGAPANVVLLNGSSGGTARGIDVATAAQLVIGVSPPPPASSSHFALFAKVGTPTALDAFALPFGIGTTCFPPSLLVPPSPDLLFLASSFGLDPTLIFPATPAPWSVTVPAGLPPGFTAAIQGVIHDASSAYRVTNGILVTVTP
jgi:hypothetical protein